ncbi:type II secretion system F family protein [Ornithinimicrobium sp. LYQ92]|uniref:type II secretion system F family protein n=1 Tax=Serinicoccus sp. LYQ92 TaxID=3378798 RepID=UPI003851D656
MSALPAGVALWAGAASLATALALAVWLLVVPSGRLPVARRRYGAAEEPGLLTQAAGATTVVIERTLARRGGTQAWATALGLAGIKVALPEFVLLVGAAALAALAVGLVVGNLVVGVLLAGFTVAGSVVFVSMRAGARRSAFADQLDDMLQLLAGNLRAGHSILQSFDSLATELEEPGATEITRVVNQTRVGRDLGDALNDAGERMDSDDFRWVAQAIAIHRQVGGNLADVLDQVGETIRERNQIRRQVKALAAEGKLSALVLLGLPFAVMLLLLVINPGYLAPMVSNVLGFLMIGLGAVMLSIGALWMRKVITVTF